MARQLVALGCAAALAASCAGDLDGSYRLAPAAPWQPRSGAIAAADDPAPGAGAPALTRHPAVEPAVEPVASPGRSGPATGDRRFIGWLELRVRWPAGQRTVARMPDTARAVQVEVFDAADRSAGSQVATRSVEGGSSTLRFGLLAGTYRLQARAFDSPAPASDSTPVALGDASNIAMRSSRTQAVSVDLRPASEPAITNVLPGNGGPGSTVRISGRNFGVPGRANLAVRFAGAPSASVQRLDAVTLLALVPEGATSGNVAVVVDGVQSGSSSPFQVIGHLLLLPLPGDLLAGQAGRLALEASDTEGNSLASPAVSWEVEPAGVATVSAGWDLVSLGAGAATVSVRARSGTVLASRAYAILPRPVAVEVSPATASLDALAADGENDAGFVSDLQLSAVVTYSDRSTDSAVAWSCSDTTIATVSAGGLVSALQNSPGGVVRITAAAIRQPARKGVATLTVRTLGEGVVTVE